MRPRTERRNKALRKVNKKQMHYPKDAAVAFLRIPDPTATEEYQSKLRKNRTI